MTVKFTPILPKGPIANPARMMAELKQAMENTVADGLAFIQEYPPSRSKWYKRTGTLRRAWSRKVTETGGGIEGTIGANSGMAPYAEDVQGENQLDLFRVYDWRNVPMLVDRVTKRLEQEANAAVKRAI